MGTTEDAVKVANQSHMVFSHVVTVVVGIKNESCWTSFESFSRTHLVVLFCRGDVLQSMNSTCEAYLKRMTLFVYAL